MEALWVGIGHFLNWMVNRLINIYWYLLHPDLRPPESIEKIEPSPYGPYPPRLISVRWYRICVWSRETFAPASDATLILRPRSI